MKWRIFALTKRTKAHLLRLCVYTRHHRRAALCVFCVSCVKPNCLVLSVELSSRMATSVLRTLLENRANIYIIAKFHDAVLWFYEDCSLLLHIDGVASTGDSLDGERSIYDVVPSGLFLVEETYATILLQCHGRVGRATVAGLYTHGPSL